MSKSGDELVTSAKQALSIAKGQANEKNFRVTNAANVDVKAIRAKLNLTQAEFAKRFNIPLGTLRDWEQYRRNPDGPARVLLTIIDREPAAVQKALSAKAKEHASA
jgi:putative transcriptional regulator